MSLGPQVQVAGLLLCRAAGHRLAFPATQVVTVEAWSQSEPFPHARTAFELPADRGRVLISAEGDAVAVDAIEVLQESVAVMPLPALLARPLGSFVAGFVTARQELWPVLRVAEFSKYLASLPAAAPVPSAAPDAGGPGSRA